MVVLASVGYLELLLWKPCMQIWPHDGCSKKVLQSYGACIAKLFFNIHSGSCFRNKVLRELAITPERDRVLAHFTHRLQWVI